MLVEFDNDLVLYSHNQLYGKWLTVAPGALPPPTNRSLRVALHTSAGSALLYSASDVALLRTDELDQHPYLSRLGVEVLDDEVAWQDVARQLLEPRFAGRALAGLYLDQHCLAGIGNYLRSEILFSAGLQPDRRPKDLTRGELGRLARATLQLTRRSYATGGITNSPRRAARLKRAGRSFEGYRFMVFDRDGAPCYACDSPIQRTEMSSRRLYFCDGCQT